MLVPHDAVQALLREAAREEILPRWRNLASADIELKQADDPVTAADRGCEDWLTSRLPKLLRGSRVVGEEAVHADPGRLAWLNGREPVWVVDPLDGTKNFARGAPPFAIMAALLRDGETLAAWILDPLDGAMLSAERGSGAYLRGERVRIVSRPDELPSLRGAILTKLLPEALRADAELGAATFAEARQSFCAGSDYRALVEGDLDFLFYFRTLIWDHAPGVLIAEEAGAIVRRLDGRPYRPTDGGSGLLVAGSLHTWHRLQSRLTPSLPTAPNGPE